MPSQINNNCVCLCGKESQHKIQWKCDSFTLTAAVILVSLPETVARQIYGRNGL